jgi:hypothetical protein
MKAYVRTHRREFSLVTFRVALHNGTPESNQFVWENDHEFRYEAAMYDVIEKEISGDTLTIYAVMDEKESALVNHYLEIIKRSHHHPSKSRAAVSLMQFLLQFNITDCLTFTFWATEVLTAYPSYHSMRLLSVYPEIITPPPQINTAG